MTRRLVFSFCSFSRAVAPESARQLSRRTRAQFQNAFFTGQRGDPARGAMIFSVAWLAFAAPENTAAFTPGQKFGGAREPKRWEDLSFHGGRGGGAFQSKSAAMRSNLALAAGLSQP